MRLVLIFPPQANPTYTPLGLAYLSGYLGKTVPTATLELIDWNLETWEQACQESEAGQRFLQFARGQAGDFFDLATYADQFPSYQEPARRLALLGMLVRRYVNLGELEPRLAAILDPLVDRLHEFAPDRVGLSLMYHSQLSWTLALARRLHERPPAAWGDRTAPRVAGTTPLRILLGGSALSTLNPEELLAACPYLDGLVLGEGEAALAALARDELPAEVPGLVERGPTGELRRHRRSRPLPLESLPRPDFSRLPLPRYFSPEPVLPVLTSRGCRWRRCRFCAHNFSFGVYRQKSVASFVDELEQHARLHQVRHFYFADQYIDAADLRLVAEELLRRGLAFHWHVMGRPTATFDEELLTTLHRAGCRWISWGVETGSQRLLDLAGKGTRVDEVRQVLLRTAAAGISSLPMMLFGLPTSTEADLEQTIELLEGVYDSIEAMTASSFVLYEDSPFGRRPEQYGLAVVGREELAAPDGRPIHSRKLHYREVGSDGSLRPPRGAVEVAQWEQRRRWLGGETLFDKLFAEHYLLLVAHRHEQRSGRPDGHNGHDDRPEPLAA